MLTYIIDREDSDINELLNKCQDKVSEGGSKFPGMTYEEGIISAIEWLTDAEIEDIYDE